MTGVFRKLEPYAMDLWEQRDRGLPAVGRGGRCRSCKQTYYGGLYQKLVLTR